MRTHAHEPNSNSPTHTRKQMQTPEWAHITPARTHITQHHHARADVCVCFKTAYSPLEAASPCVISVDTAMRVRQPKRTLGAAAQEDCPALVFPGACNPSSNLRRARCPFRHQGSTSNSDAKNTNTPQHPQPDCSCSRSCCALRWSILHAHMESTCREQLKHAKCIQDADAHGRLPVFLSPQQLLACRRLIRHLAESRAKNKNTKKEFLVEFDRPQRTAGKGARRGWR